MLLGSFPRVKTLTLDLQLVKDVLTLSSLVEVRGDWVRPHKWSRFALPDAAPSVVDADGTSPDQVARPPVDIEQLVLQNPPAKNDVDAPTVSGEPPVVTVIAQVQQTNGIVENVAEEHHEYEDEDDEDEEDDVVFVLGKDANRSWTPERSKPAES